MTNSIASKRRREIANNHHDKLRLISKRIRELKSGGHDYTWIAERLGMSESGVRNLYASPVL